MKLFGHQTLVTIQESADPSQVSFKLTGSDHTLVINLHQSSPSNQATKNKKTAVLLQRFLVGVATKYVVTRTQQLAKVMGIKYGRISIREQRSRWGSCSSRGNLNFNWRLVHFPTEIIDYVIIHELAHRLEMNHSAKFWQIVAKYDPAHRIHRGHLKRQAKDATIDL